MLCGGDPFGSVSPMMAWQGHFLPAEPSVSPWEGSRHEAVDSRMSQEKDEFQKEWAGLHTKRERRQKLVIPGSVKEETDSF